MTRVPFIVALVLGLAGSALAQTPAELIEQYEAAARTLTEQEAGAGMAEEIGTLRAWLGEARAFESADEPEKVRQRLELARAQIRLIEAAIERARVEAAVRTAEDATKARTAAAAEVRNQAFGLEQRLAELEAQTGGVAPADGAVPAGDASPTPAPPPGGAP